MPPHTEDSTGDDEKPKRSKLGVLVPETVQKDNRALVKYLHDGSKRNRLGPETTDRLTAALALYFWQHPDELKPAAYSKHTDVDPEAFMQRINDYQQKHLEEAVEATKEVAKQAAGKGDRPDTEGLQQPGPQMVRPEVPISNQSQRQQPRTAENSAQPKQKPESLDEHDPNIPDDVPMMGDAPQNRNVSQDARRKAVNRAEDTIKEAIKEEPEGRIREIAKESVREEMEAVESRLQAMETRFASMLERKLEELETEQTDP